MDAVIEGFQTVARPSSTAASSSTAELFGSVIDRLGMPDFHPTLRRALYELTGFNSCIILGFREGEAPTVLERCSSIQPDRFRHGYMKRAYQFDPFYRAAVEKRSIGASRYLELSGPDFHSSDYFNLYYKDVPLVDEIGILCPIEDGHTVHISLGRAEGSELFDGSILARLQNLEPLVASLVRRHSTLCALQQASVARRPEAEPAGDASLLVGFDLTRRESEVATLVLRGHTNSSIAAVLGLSEHTVKVHRKRLYSKLSISSQAELFMLSMKKRPN